MHPPRVGLRSAALLFLVAVAAGFLGSAGPLSAQAQPPLAMEYAAPGVTSYLADVPSPRDVMGVDIGERHIRPDEIVEYVRIVAEASDRVVLGHHGRTYQGRPLVHAIVTSPANHARLEEIRQANLRLSDDPNGVSDADLAGMPTVVYMGYSVHGNEASGSDAGILTLHHLAAGQGPGVEAMLDNLVVILDPSLNPDGRARFVNWVTDNRGRVPTVDPQDREHNEPWPNGRTNHYIFDLNRDWLPSQHPESQGRVELFHRWRPQLHTDFHEMGGGATFFFQPGVPSRDNPNTPQHTIDLTLEVARFHARNLDAVGELYYAQESFDDHYYGKGSTYPDVHGAVGILFEQASSRALRADTPLGILPYAETVRNQFATSLSTLQAGVELREQLLANQRRHYAEIPAFVAATPTKGWLVSLEGDRTRAQELAQMLQRNRIRLHNLGSTVERDGITFRPGEAFIVPLDQPQARLIHGALERRTNFPDSLFYDVSTWTMTLAFGVPHAELTAVPSGLVGAELGAVALDGGEVRGGRTDYAYLMEWNRFYAPRALNRFLEAGILPRVTYRPFSIRTAEGTVLEVERGSILIPVQYRLEGARYTPEDVHRLVQEAAREDHVVIHALSSGFPEGEVWPGGSATRVLDLPRVALLAGRGASGAAVGETWHLLNERMGVPVSLVDVADVAGLDLSRYNTLVMAGNIGGLSEAATRSITEWVRGGGLLITTEGGVRWPLAQGLLSTTIREAEVDLGNPSYEDRGDRAGAQVIGGSIFQVELDPTHPIAFGYGATVPTFRAHNLYLEPVEDPGVTVGRYAQEPLISGYIHEYQIPFLQGSASILAARAGQGRVVSFLDNPNFRAFWHGTNHLFLNAIFFGRGF
jgi:hypothetical protein